MEWYYMQNGERKGPVGGEAIKALLGDGTLSKDSLVQNENMGQTWAKISVIPALAGSQLSPLDSRAEQGPPPKPQERVGLVTLAVQWCRARKRLAMAGAAIAGLLIVGIVFLARSRMARWGSRPDATLGILANLESRLVGKYEMEKETLYEFTALRQSAAQMYRYSKPKRGVSQHVSGAGGVVVLASENGMVDAMLASFPTPGTHSGAKADPSLMGSFMNEIWVEQGGTKERVFKPRDEALSQEVQETCGLTDLPSDGGYAVIENGRRRGFWIEFGADHDDTIVYLETKR